MHRRTILSAAGAAMVVGAVDRVMAQTFPAKPIRLIVPFPPGGTTDLIARVVADKLGQLLGQTVIVDNKAGAGGMLGATETARAAPDGYTLGMVTASTGAAGPAINPKTPHNPVTDFTPIVNIAATPNVIAVSSGFPSRDFKAFLAELKRSPGKYAYASAGTGSLAHLQMELFKSLTGTFITHIPYRGAAPALNDTMAGQTAMILDNLPTALPFIKAGRLIPIVVSAPNRLALLPNVPTFKEVGYEPVNRMAFFGMYGPKALPHDIVNKVNAAVKKALEDPAVKKRIEDTGSIVIAKSPDEFAAQIKMEYELYKQVVEKQKLSAD